MAMRNPHLQKMMNVPAEASPSAKFAACDFGAESGRVVLGRLRDGRVELDEIHRFPNRQVRMLGHWYWDLPSLFAELKAGLARLASRGHRDLLGIGVDTWGVDFGLLNADGEILANPCTYRDPRTEGMMETAFTQVPREEMYRITGVQFLQLNTVFQLLSLVRGRRRILEGATRLLFMPDLFHYLLTGEALTEYTIASTSQLLDARSRNWSKPLFERLALPLDLMQTIVPPGTPVGPLLPEVQQETGLGPIPVLAPAGHDTACAVAAVPAKGTDWGYLSSGTWSLVGVETTEPIINADSLACNFTNEGGFGHRIRLLRNNMGLWLLERCRSAWAAAGRHTGYDELVQQAAAAPPFRSLIDPDDPSFLNPPSMPDAIAAWCRRAGQPVPETEGQFARTIFESLALKYRVIVGQANRLRGKRIEILHVVGGGSRNALLNQFTADALGIPVAAGPVEATALGNILIQSVAAGELSGLEEIRQTVRNSVELTWYEPRHHEAWLEQRLPES
jgi:rhamnulokinase